MQSPEVFVTQNLFRVVCKEHNLISVKVFDLDFPLFYISLQKKVHTQWLKQVAGVAFPQPSSFYLQVCYFGVTLPGLCNRIVLCVKHHRKMKLQKSWQCPSFNRGLQEMHQHQHTETCTGGWSLNWVSPRNQMDCTLVNGKDGILQMSTLGHLAFNIKD